VNALSVESASGGLAAVRSGSRRTRYRIVDAATLSRENEEVVTSGVPSGKTICLIDLSWVATDKGSSVGSAFDPICDVEDETAPIVIIIGNDKPAAGRRKHHGAREPERCRASNLACGASFRRDRLA
jgi:hypothetical protein